MKNFTFKKFAIFLFACIFVGISAGAFFYYYDFNKATEKIKKDCLERLANASDEEMVKEIINMPIEREVDVYERATRQTEKLEAGTTMVAYFFKKTRFLDNDAEYEALKENVKNLIYKQESKEKILDALERLYKVDFLFKLANNKTDIEELNDLCLKSIKTISDIRDKEKKDFEEGCDSIFKTQESLEEYFNRVMENYDDWSEDNTVLKYSYRIKGSLSYRLGGMEAAKKICEFAAKNENNETYQNCLIFFEEIDEAINNPSPNELKEKTKEIICSAQ